MLREDNSVKSRTYVYSYDHAGNILSKKAYALTAEGETPSTLYSTNTYGYNDADWGDLLTSFNGHAITYDAIGNPLSYYNGSSYSFTWKNGRQLATATKGSDSLSFDYNDEGIRTSKTVNGVEHTYSLSGSQIVAEEWGSNLCVYLYDADGSPIGMQYRTTSMAEGVFYTFWFEKNLQGDIVAVYNEDGVKVCTYTYDAWGNVTLTWVNSLATNLYAVYNPFKYRGYYHDTETGFYYLQSRYYDPIVGRFINADVYINSNGGLVGCNMYTYCSNNPVMYLDPTGEIAIVDDLVIWGLFSLVAVAVIVISTPVIVDTTEYIVESARQATAKIAEDFTILHTLGEELRNQTISDMNERTNDLIAPTHKKGRQGPVGKPGRKKQGREVNEKKRGKDNWVSNSNKDSNRPMKKHTPGRDHRKAFFIPHRNENEDRNIYRIRWCE